MSKLVGLPGGRRAKSYSWVPFKRGAEPYPPDDELVLIAVLDTDTDPNDPERGYFLGYWLDKYKVWMDHDGGLINDYDSMVVTHWSLLFDPEDQASNSKR